MNASNDPRAAPASFGQGEPPAAAPPAVGGRLSDRIHAAADDRARALGWEVNQTPGRLGLSGRSYHDPQFTVRQRTPRDTPTRRG
jgi:hypothetical protein